MLSFADLNSFIISHAQANYFDADLKLYKKHFPNSKLIQELEKAPEYARKNLDERMIYELLNDQDSCIDCIWENRGFIRDNNEHVLPVTPKKEAKKVEATKPTAPVKPNADIAAIDLKKLKYNALKKLIFDYDLQAKCTDQKQATYLAVLSELQTAAAPQAEPKQTTAKKKEGRAPNTHK